MLNEDEDHVLLIDPDKILTYQETKIVSQVAQRET
jgi:heptaprenylglyceryl phosphate synthase